MLITAFALVFFYAKFDFSDNACCILCYKLVSVAVALISDSWQFSDYTGLIDAGSSVIKDPHCYN